MTSKTGEFITGAGPIQYPFYSPRGEFRIQDSDGYVIMVTHT